MLTFRRSLQHQQSCISSMQIKLTLKSDHKLYILNISWKLIPNLLINPTDRQTDRHTNSTHISLTAVNLGKWSTVYFLQQLVLNLCILAGRTRTFHILFHNILSCSGTISVLIHAISIKTRQQPNLPGRRHYAQSVQMTAYKW